MDFSFTEEQELLRNSLQAFLRDRYGFEARRAAARGAPGMRREIWTAMAQDLGILSATMPERVGGLGADAVTTMVVMEELGRALVVEPFLETVVLCGGLLSRSGGALADDTLRRIGTGEEILAFAWSEPQTRYDFTRVATSARREGPAWRIDGVKSVVIAAPWASQLLITARTGESVGQREGLSLFLLDKNTAGISATEYPTIDDRRAADITFANVRVPADALIGAEGEALEAIEAVTDTAIAALCAEAVGVLSTLQWSTVEYTKQRRQFGQPIAAFQALQHRMVDMYMHVEMAQSATYLATLKLSASPLERALAASTAKVTVNNACRFVGQNAIQLHGGMGMTDELAISHYFKRATAIESELGSVDFHLQRHAALSRTLDNVTA
ncbi:MAG: acyl-CoA dehydrogenase family protein [Steroidobacteraceae bacterium]